MRRVAAGTLVCGALGLGAAPLVASGGAPAASAAVRPHVKGPVPFRTIVGDFNGDGRRDNFFYTPGTGPDWMVYGTASGFVNGPAVKVDGNYTVVVGDFNGDTRSDILWYDAKVAHNSTVWYGSYFPGFVHGGLLDPPLATVYDTVTPSTSDFDNDGKTDILFFNVGPGGYRHHIQPSQVWYGSDSGFDMGVPIATPKCNPKYAPAAGGSACLVMTKDFNGDHLDDIFEYRMGSQADKLLYSKGRSFGTAPRVAVDGTYSPLNADFNGDGRSDILWYAPGTAPDAIWYALPKGFDASHPITIDGTYTPVIGDFNGDKKSDILWYGQGSVPDGLWYGGAPNFTLGPAVAVTGVYAPIVGDFNGDKKTDIIWAAAPGQPSPVWYGATNGFVNGPSLSL